jgi:hypothetical protein
MSSFDFDGALRIETDTHTVEYEPGQMTGSKTLFLRIKGGDKNVPIFVSKVDDVIEMLRRGKLIIDALEQ